MYRSVATRVGSVLEDVPIDTGGGCSVEKAVLLAELIASEDMKHTLDIGVYRGRSLLPQAIAHSMVTGGVAYGVDPWDSGEAEQREVPAEKQIAVAQWLQATDLSKIYQDLTAVVAKHHLNDNCVLIRKTSTAAIAFFREQRVWFDMIHIDGNHDRQRVEADIELYLPRLRHGGYLVLDDIAWESIRPTYESMRRKLSHVFELVDTKNEFAVYWNSREPFGVGLRRLKLLQVAPAARLRHFVSR